MTDQCPTCHGKRYLFPRDRVFKRCPDCNPPAPVDPTNRVPGAATLTDDVTDFHRVMGLPVATVPAWPDWDTVGLRRRLITEEYYELLGAITERDMADTADAAADLVYVVIGMCLTFGIPFDRVWRVVHAANMAKVGPDGTVKRREDGKVLKPDGWTPPDVKGALEGRMERGTIKGEGER